MVRNPSELQRILEEALSDERVYLLDALHRNTTSKAAKENILRRIRIIERELGIEGLPYNSDGFGGR